MDDNIKRALQDDTLVDITTTGRKSGKQHTVEVGLRQIDGQLYLPNNPGTRDWAANLLTNSEFTYHLKQSVQQALKAQAKPIRDETVRRGVFTTLLTKEGRMEQLEARMDRSHLFKIDLLNI
jgi:hypothetical protein